MLYLHGMGHFHPPTVIDNDFLESLDIGVDQKWVLERVGIRTRRTVLSLDYLRETRNHDPRAAAEASAYDNAQTGAEAARMALSRAGLETSVVGLVISGGCSPQFNIPSEACRIAAELGINAPAFDMHSACSSFALQMHFLNSMRPEALPDFVLVVNPENNTRTVDYTDRRTAVLWGDGTAAAVVSARVPSNRRIKFSTFTSDPKGWDKVVIPAAGHFQQDGQAVQAFAIKKTVETVNGLRRQAAGGGRDLYFIGHQANLRMLQSACGRVEIEPERHFYNVDRYGNCGAAGAPGVLSERWDDLKGGDEVALAVVGSGLAWGGLLLEARL
jgi:3-oxoacyl-[acyl-carrier-protein] synthase III